MPDNQNSNDTNLRISDLAGRAPGEDDENPYENIDISTLPEWWQQAIREFEEYNLRPYCPPRFEDGVLKHEVVDQLETQFDIDIIFIGISSKNSVEWQIRVDGEMIGTIGKRRSPNGYTVFEMNSDEVSKLIQQAVEDQ